MEAVVRGVRLALHPEGDYVSDVIRDTGDFYEWAILDELARRIPGGTLVDVGAHIGNHTAFLAAFTRHVRIHAFEPILRNVDLLRWNVAPWPEVEVHPIALGDRIGIARLKQDAVNAGHSRISDTGELEAELATLDSFGLSRVTLVKIDVEGSEPQVLAGARETIERWHPLIVIEDWKREYAELLPGYQLAAEWETAHQTFLYQWP